MATKRALGVRRVDIFGSLEPLTRLEAEAEAVSLMAAYRETVQDLICDGRAFSDAHAEAAPFLDQARTLLHAEGWSGQATESLLAREFHG